MFKLFINNEIIEFDKQRFVERKGMFLLNCFEN